ncbi:putative E3 SUMO-protein ligase RNF212 isoform X2 [Rhinoraja longicauda]
MALCVFCNNCFQQPKANGSRFALTNCGHVVCEMCLRKGGMDVCCVCKARCHTIFLSDKMDPDLKALFTQPEKVCEMYLKEFMQIMDFQEKHRRHLCAKETEEKAKLKAYVEHITQSKEQLQRELAENKNYITKLESTFQQRAHKMELDGRPCSSGKDFSSLNTSAADRTFRLSVIWYFKSQRRILGLFELQNHAISSFDTIFITDILLEDSHKHFKSANETISYLDSKIEMQKFEDLYQEGACKECNIYPWTCSMSNSAVTPLTNLVYYPQLIV